MTPDEAGGRLSLLFEISKCLTRIQRIEETVRAVIALVDGALPLRSAVVLVTGQAGTTTIAHVAPGADGARAEARARVALAYLLGEPPDAADDGPPEAGGHFLALPFVVETRPIFGLMQVETAARPSERDLVFLNVVANQLAIGLEWRTVLDAREAKTEAAGRAREAFVAVVSHDLRNELDAILMSVALLLRNRRTGAEARRAVRNLQAIRRAAEAMNRLIGDLLDLARIESGHLTLSLRAERVADLVDGALWALNEQALSRRIRLSQAFPAPAVEVTCDLQRIRQVLTNLVGNAVKFTAPGGSVSVSAEPRGDAVCFAVADTGPGIAPEDLPHVFEPHWQASRTSRLGSGLGLSISAGIVALHGGTIWLESEPGVGTTAYFTLPRASPSPS